MTLSSHNSAPSGHFKTLVVLARLALPAVAVLMFGAIAVGKSKPKAAKFSWVTPSRKRLSVTWIQSFAKPSPN